VKRQSPTPLGQHGPEPLRASCWQQFDQQQIEPVSSFLPSSPLTRAIAGPLFSGSLADGSRLKSNETD